MNPIFTRVITQSFPVLARKYAFQPTWNKVRVPEGDFKVLNGKRQGQYNLIFLSGLVSLVASISSVFFTDAIDYNFYPPKHYKSEEELQQEAEERAAIAEMEAAKQAAEAEKAAAKEDKNAGKEDAKAPEGEPAKEEEAPPPPKEEKPPGGGD